MKTIDDKIEKMQRELATLRKQKRMEEKRELHEATLALGKLVADRFGAHTGEEQRQLCEVLAVISEEDILARLADSVRSDDESENETSQEVETMSEGEAETHDEAPSWS